MVQIPNGRRLGRRRKWLLDLASTLAAGDWVVCFLLERTRGNPAGFTLMPQIGLNPVRETFNHRQTTRGTVELGTRSN